LVHIQSPESMLGGQRIADGSIAQGNPLTDSKDSICSRTDTKARMATAASARMITVPLRVFSLPDIGVPIDLLSCRAGIWTCG
jgi:hypothetical protein